MNVYLKAVLKLRNLIRPFHFADMRIKNRGAQGNIITKHPVERVSRIMPAAKAGNETAEEEPSAPAGVPEPAENVSAPVEKPRPQDQARPALDSSAEPPLEQGSLFDA